MNISGKPLSRAKIRDLTRYVRKEFDLENVMYFPIVPVIETMAIDDTQDFNFEVVDDYEMTETYGKTNTEKNIMLIRENVYEGAICGNPRDRFTLCHEFGHLLLHQPVNISYARGDIPTYCNPEWQANVFAAELLIPYYLAKGMSIKDITQNFGVSYSCAEIQKKYI